MRTQYKIGIGAIGSAIILGGVLLSQTPSDVQESGQELPVISEVTSPSRSLAESKAPETEKVAEVQPAEKAPSFPAAEPAEPEKPFAFQKELGDYAYLKRKVLLTEADRIEKKRLLQNDRFLRSLEELLKRNTTSDFEAEQQQNIAVDLLFESLEGENSQVAAEVLRSIVQDSQVENSMIDVRARENLAGLKAEILYNWTSLEPEKSDEIRSWLPGPVSERIWRNVLAAQQNNLEESLLEANSRRE